MKSRKTVLDRAQLRTQGMRPIQIWVPDVRTRAFVAAARKQAKAVAASHFDTADQTFIDSVSDPSAD
jgi:hypothetical protein